MDTNLVVGLLGGGGVAAILSAIVTGLFSKRKLGADAAEIITKAAAGVVHELTEQAARNKVEHAEQIAKNKVEHDAEIAKRDLKYEALVTLMEQMKADHEQEREDVRRVLQLHVAWDAIALARLGELGVDLPPVPPLTPPTRYGVVQSGV